VVVVVVVYYDDDNNDGYKHDKASSSDMVAKSYKDSGARTCRNGRGLVRLFNFSCKTTKWTHEVMMWIPVTAQCWKATGITAICLAPNNLFS
jgi:hypothetical protein